jgi:hypothetical protein
MICPFVDIDDPNMFTHPLYGAVYVSPELPGVMVVYSVLGNHPPVSLLPTADATPVLESTVIVVPSGLIPPRVLSDAIGRVYNWSSADSTPSDIVNLSPTLIPPRVFSDAVGRV